MRDLRILAITLIISGCGPEIKHRDQTSDFDNTQARYHSNNTNLNRALPDSFVRCPNNFFWSTRPFNSKSTEYDYTRAENALQGPTKHGSGFSHVNNWPSKIQLQTCLDIGRKIKEGWDLMDYDVYQYFDNDTVLKLIQSNNHFHVIAPKLAYLKNTSYYIDFFKQKMAIYELNIPVSVTCENNWLARQYTQYPFKVLFQQPKGKCRFSTQHYELQLDSERKFIIALNGSYEIDQAHPDKVMLVRIENFGFLSENI
jgi:hypothetical protein